MPAPFHRTLRSLENDGGARSALQATLLLALLAAWLGWFLFARIAVWVAADHARVEVARQVHEVQASTSGRLVESNLALGREVQAGDLLARLDSEAEQLKLEEERKKGLAAQAQLVAQRAEIAAEERALLERRVSAKSMLAEAQARSRESAEQAKQGDEELARLLPLRAQGLISDAELARTKSKQKQLRSEAEATAVRERTLDLDEQTAQTRDEARIAALRGEEARLIGLFEGSRAAADSLSAEIERRTIRAPIAGQLGRAAPLQIGAFVRDGDLLAAVVPKGELRVVADFAPQGALGRVRSGQPARMRLHGFSWTQYGMLPATVANVGSEALQGLIRVELSVDPGAGVGIPLQHGLPGDLEVEIERVSPAVLVLRAAGALVDGHK